MDSIGVELHEPPPAVNILAAQSVQKFLVTRSLADGSRVHMQAMGMMNKQMNLPALTKIMREFERQNEKMDMTSEMMGDAIDDAFEVRVIGTGCPPDDSAGSAQPLAGCFLGAGLLMHVDGRQQ